MPRMPAGLHTRPQAALRCWQERSRSIGPAAGEEFTVAKFMDVHSGFVGVTEEQLRAAHEQDLAVLRVHEKAGHPAEEIYEVTVEIAGPDAAS